MISSGSSSRDLPPPLRPRGFSLDRSTSFSEKHDESDPAKFEGYQIANAPKNLQQKYTKQIYGSDVCEKMNPEPKQLLDIRNRQMVFAENIPQGYPIKRKPFVFESGGKLNVVSDHIEEIKHAAQKNS